jgi:hypothetical protein
MSTATRITFVTYGVLVALLRSRDGFDYSHVVLDEVHERSVDLDVSLLALRPRLARCKLILMSATADPETFAEYLPGLTTATIPGRAFAVESLHLEDALRDTGYVCDSGGAYSCDERDRLGDAEVVDVVDGEIAGLEKDIEDREDREDGEDGGVDGGGLRNLRSRLSKLISARESVARPNMTRALLSKKSLAATSATYNLPQHLSRSLRTMNHDVIHYDLIVMLVANHVNDVNDRADDGDILIFLPGVKEINALQSLLLVWMEQQQHHQLLKDGDVLIIPLHSKSPSRTDIYTPSTWTKVILSTNVSEASITIPTVTLVIDSGYDRCQRLDSVTNIPQLVTMMANRSSVRQRRGRAGRVREGKCYHLFLREIEDMLECDRMPEVKNCNVETLSLRVRGLMFSEGSDGSDGTNDDDGSICSQKCTRDLLSELITPPDTSACDKADEMLLSYKAIRDDYTLTDYGQVLSALPLNIHQSRCIIAGHRLGCLYELCLFMCASTSTTRGAHDRKMFDKYSDHIALIRSSEKDYHVKQDANRLYNTVCDVLGKPYYISRSPYPAIFTSLLIHNKLHGVFSNGAIQFTTEQRTHILRPHQTSVISDCKRNGVVVFSDVIRLPKGVVAVDNSLLSDCAVAMFTDFEVKNVTATERALLRELKERVERVSEGSERGGKEMDDVLNSVLNDLIPPWSGLPEGWLYDDTDKLYKTKCGGVTVKQRPVRTADYVLKEKASAKGSLERAERELGGKGGDRGKPPPTITAPLDQKGMSKKTKGEVSEEEAKRAVKERLRVEEEKERKAAAKTGKKGGLVSRMLADLDLEGSYGSKFVAAGFDDDQLRDIMDMLKESGEDEKEEGRTGVEDMISRVGLVGGSAAKVRRFLVEGKKPAQAPGKTAKGKKEGVAVAPPPKAAAQAAAAKKKKKKKDDLGDLLANLK